MSYADELAKNTRIKVDLIEIVGDYCNNTYGSSPCTASGASGSECYNTYPTCQDTSNFSKTTKTYQFVNADLPLSVVNDYYGAKPYIKSIDDVPTEIKETDTVVKRLKADFYDEIDNDVAIDPYYATRASTQGTFWKKWLARNKNYKGRLIKQYEGFEGLASGDFSLKFVGKIDNITIERGTVTIEAVDLLESLSKIEYPLKTTKTNVNIIGAVYEAVSATGMTELPALRSDYCIRRDYPQIGFSASASNGGSGALAAGTYNLNLIYYDDADRPYAESSGNVVVGGSGDGYISISWTDPSDLNYVAVYAKISSGNWQWLEDIDEGVQAATINNFNTAVEQDPPAQAEVWYALNDDDPTVVGNWEELHGHLTLEVSDTTGLETSGYMKIDDEIIYFEYDLTAVLTHIQRGQFNTNMERHNAGSIVYIAFYYATPQNPFTLLKDILDTAGITSSYIDTNFTTLESAWSGINFATYPIVKNKLNEIYFDLVNAVDCISWVGEDGKVKIKEHSDYSGTIPVLSDTENFINDSISVDLNEESRYTRWILYWDRYTIDGSITDEDNYLSLTIAIDSVAEGANEYNDSVEDIQTSTWISSANDTVADVAAYVNALLTSRKNRTRDARTIIEAEIELKDTTVKTGDIVYVSTSKIQNTDGTNYSNEMFRIIKKTMMGNKAKLKMLRIIPVPAQELSNQQGLILTTQKDEELYMQG